MAANRRDWAAAYWCQSKSDWHAFQVLMQETGVLSSSSLHFLQMATEKIAKAYRFRDSDTSVEILTTSHVAFSKFISTFLKSPSIKAEYKGRDAHLQAMTKEARGLAREVEKLAPAVDRSNSPENCEYPWESGDKVVVPAEYTFPNLWKLATPGGIIFLDLIKRAIYEFESERA